MENSKEEIKGKGKLNFNAFPKSINVNAKAIKKNTHIAGGFNKYFTNIGPNVSSKIQNASKTFEDFLFPVGKNMEYKDIFPNNLKKILSQ